MIADDVTDIARRLNALSRTDGAAPAADWFATPEGCAFLDGINFQDLRLCVITDSASLLISAFLWNQSQEGQGFWKERSDNGLDDDARQSLQRYMAAWLALNATQA